MTDSVIHSILISDDMPSLWEIERRLREHGYTPERGDVHRDWGKRMVSFRAPREADLSFLVPDFLPPHAD